MLKSLFLACALTLALPGLGQAQSTEEPSEAAMTFVGAFSDGHLTSMLQRIGARQPIMVAASQLNGQVLAAVFDAEIAQAVKVHGPQWQRNMALSWTPLLSDDEMLSLVAEGAGSPHSEKYLELRSEAGQTMQGLSGEFFKTILADVIAQTMKQLGDDAPEQ
ncbi:MAG: hypothetical protein AAGB15_10050 [Pseudomonadota bacterium]